MKQFVIILVAAFAASLFFTSPPQAEGAAACPADSRRVGPVCVDKFEASVWEIPNLPANKGLINKVKKGTATLANLTSASAIANGVVQRGVALDDYPCGDDGNDCTNIYAVSIPGVTPSGQITWFQAQQAAMNSGKRLLTNAEWQGAAAGTPDPGVSAAGSQDCNTKNGGGAGIDAVVDTGSRTNCVSRFGVFDMVGNLLEWVADWVPRSTTCVAALFAGDENCLAGADTTSGPGALLRGGFFGVGALAGVFTVFGDGIPSDTDGVVGFRAGR
jgi:hypothetical protein